MANGMTEAEKEEWLRTLDEQIEASHVSLMGKYGTELKGLLGLSRGDIDAITPGVTDLETYDKLIVVVKAASVANVSQALLKERIEALGEIGVSIARRVAGLAKLFV